MQETLPVLLRMVDPEELSKYNSMTPTALDFLAYYKDGIHPMPFQLDTNYGLGRPVAYFRISQRQKHQVVWIPAAPAL